MSPPPISIPTPDTDHLSLPKYKDKVYEPAEDTYLLLDALEADRERIFALDPIICLEIGCGSGCVSTFLGLLLKHRPNCKIALIFCTDINPLALEAARETGLKHGVNLQVIRTDLVSSLYKRLQGKIDILLFNPPYVITGPEEVGSVSIEAAWAGGVDGRQVTDQLLPLVSNLLSPKGLFYLVTIKENRPAEIQDWMEKSYGLSSTTVLKRKAGIEGLSILRFSKDKTRF